MPIDRVFQIGYSKSGIPRQLMLHEIETETRNKSVVHPSENEKYGFKNT
jgi:hypothetical protein